MDRPVTDIKFVSSVDKCPQGYTLISQCPCGHDANLWVKFLGAKSEERYICYTKEEREDGKIVEDMYIPGKGERYIIKGFEVIKRTVEGNDTLNHRFIAYKRTKASRAEKAIYDVSVFRSKDKPSSTFRKLGAKLNNLYICVREAPYKKPNTTSATPTATPTATNTSSPSVAPPTAQPTAISKRPSFDATPPYKEVPSTQTGHHDNTPSYDYQDTKPSAPPTTTPTYNQPTTSNEYQHTTTTGEYTTPPTTGGYTNTGYSATPTTGGYTNTGYSATPTTGGYNNTGYSASPNMGYSNTGYQASSTTGYSAPPTAPPTTGYQALPTTNYSSSHSGSSNTGGIVLGFDHLDMDQPIPDDWTWEDDDDDEEEDHHDHTHRAPVHEMATLDIAPTLYSAPPTYPSQYGGYGAPPTSSYPQYPPGQSGYPSPYSQPSYSPQPQYRTPSYPPSQYGGYPPTTGGYPPPATGGYPPSYGYTDSGQYGGNRGGPPYPPATTSGGSYYSQYPPGPPGSQQQRPSNNPYGGIGFNV